MLIVAYATAQQEGVKKALGLLVLVGNDFPSVRLGGMYTLECIEKNQTLLLGLLAI